MYKISLINMPFTVMEIPSIALTQLSTVVRERFADQVRVRILYLNHDFVHYLGYQSYLALMTDSNNNGLGEWFYRQVAFPKAPDNTREYFQRYHPHLSEEQAATKGRVLAKRIGLERFMRQLNLKYQLDKESLVGFSTMFSQNLPSMAMARVIKDVNPNTVTIMGGANCEAPMGCELARNASMIDYVFSGPGLISFPEFVGCHIEGEAEKCSSIQGVFTSSNLDSRPHHGLGAMGKELPIEVPVPLDYESYLDAMEKNFAGKFKPAIPFETSRGCWWGAKAHCTFCGLNGGTMAYRAMPSQMAVEFIQDLMQRYGDRASSFQSVDNIMPREYLTDVFPHVRAPSGVNFFYEVKADLSDKDMEILSKASVTDIQPGIESLNTGTLKLMKKGTTAFRNIVFLKNCVRFGIRPAWNLLIGFPREREEVYKKYLQDLPLLPHLPPPAGAFPVRFDRFSPYHARADEYGLELFPYDFYRYLYPFPEESLKDLAYYFEDRNYNAQYMVEMIAWQKKLMEALDKWKERWNASDGKLKGELFLKRRQGIGPVVHDTRSGQLVEHEIDALGLQLIDLLDDRGRKLPDIVRRLEIEESTASAELARLQKLNLIFQENDRYLSLIVAGRQAATELQGLDLEAEKTGMARVVDQGLGHRLNL